MTDDENRSETPKRGHLIGYARVSTDDQNLDLQIDALLKYGVDELDIYKDYATGKNMNRPEWKAMLKDAREGDTIVIWKLDRLSRNVIEGSTEVQRLYKRNVKVVSLDGELNFDTAYGRFMFYLKLALAELEVDQIGERTRAGLKSAKARGRVLSGWRRNDIEKLKCDEGFTQQA